MPTKTSIQKLTPPQIGALRQAFPGLVGAGILTTTRSVATFDLGEHEPEHPMLQGWEPTPERIERLLFGAGLAGTIDQDRALPIIKKLQTGKDVVTKDDPIIKKRA